MIQGKMKLAKVSEWLKNRDMANVADVCEKYLTNHDATTDGWTDTNMINNIFVYLELPKNLFKELECDVITYMEVEA